MIKRLIKKIGVAIIVAAVMVGVTAMAGISTKDSTSAVSYDDVYRTIVLNMMNKCYTAATMSSSVELIQYRQNSNTPQSAFSDYVLNGSSSGRVIIPTTKENAKDVNGATYASCQELFLGGGNMARGIFDLFGKPVPNPSSATVGQELANIGYTESEIPGEAMVCLRGSYYETARGKVDPADAGMLCWEQNSTAKGKGVANSALGGGALYAKAVSATGPTGYNGSEIWFNDGANSCRLAVFTENQGIENLSGLNGTSCSTTDFTIDLVFEETNASAFETRKIKSFSDAYATARRYFSGVNAVLPQISSEGKYELYMNYLRTIYEMESGSSQCKKRSNLASPVYEENGYKYYYVYENGHYYSKTFKNSNLDVSVFKNNASSQMLDAYCGDVDCVVNQIWNLNLPEAEGTCEEEPGGGEDPGGGGGGPTGSDPFKTGNIVDCNQFENVGAMQWVLCPVANNAQYSANMLDTFTEDMLKVNTKVYDGGDVERVWKALRTIANVLMTIFLLVVIFSQLTGYGIDNYGVKKMLPRIIMMAILINLSLYICQIAIDLSNIFGKGLLDLFGALGNSVGGDYDLSYTGGMIVGTFASAGAVQGGVGAGAAIFGLVGSVTVAVWVAVLVAIFLIIVALFVLYAMLGIRSMIIIACVVLSPLAFAAYVLPNTQNLFKKWWELFKAAIIIFPICGALGGISYLLKSMTKDLMASNPDPAMHIVMMILPYVVFFLIPMMLKNAISALGKMGGALTALGGTVRSGARTLGNTGLSAAKNTETYKNWQNEGARKRQSQSADRTIRRLEELKRREGSLSDADTRRLARAHEAKRKLSGEDMAARTILAEKEYASLSQDRMVEDWNRAFDDGDVDKMNALTNVITTRFGAGGVNAMAKKFAEKDGVNAQGEEVGIFNSQGEFRNAAMERSFTAFQANMMQNKVLSSTMRGKASDVFQMVSSGGYANKDADGNSIVDANGQATSKRQNLSAHTANNGMATQIKDWATQSSASLQRAAASGMLTPEMMRNILSSNDPAVQSGIKSDTDKRRILEAGASGMMSSRTNSTPNLPGGGQLNWGNERDIDKAAQSYRVQSEGMQAGYANKTADQVYDEAIAENASRERQKQSEINELHGRALDENAEWNRRDAEKKAQQKQNDDLINAANRAADSIERTMNNNRKDGETFNQGGGI